MLRTAVLSCLSGLSDYTCTQSHPLAVFPKWHKYCSNTGDEQTLSWVWSSRCLSIYGRTTTATSITTSQKPLGLPRTLQWVIDRCSLPQKGTQISCLEFPMHGNSWLETFSLRPEYPSHHCLIYTSESIQLCWLLLCSDTMQLIEYMVKTPTGWTTCTIKGNRS